MNIRPIESDTDYKAALAEIESLMLAEPNTPEGDRLDVLVTLVEAYELKHFRCSCRMQSPQSNTH